MSSRVPVVLLSGGLGSGKTTLLNHLLHRGIGRVGVVINDFGDVNVDAFLVQGQVDATATISGGCLCCLSDPGELDDTLAALAAPALGLDVIVVEASGLAEPRELARMILASGVRRIRFGGVVELIDASTWLTGGGDGTSHAGLPIAVDHLQVASLLVINKVDLLAGQPEAAARLDATLARYAPTTPVVRTTFGRLDPALLFDAADRPEPVGQLSFTDLLHDLAGGDAAPVDSSTHRGGTEPHDHPHLHENHTSVSVESPLSASPRELVAFLESRDAGVYRVKGRTWVAVPGRRHQYVVQAVGGWLAFERRPWPDGETPRTQLVAIGTGMDESRVRRSIESCLTDGPVPADHLHAMTRFTR